MGILKNENSKYHHVSFIIVRIIKKKLCIQIDLSEPWPYVGSDYSQVKSLRQKYPHLKVGIFL